MEDSGSIGNNLEMRPSEINEGPMVVVMDQSSKLSLFYGSGQFVDDNEQVEGNGIAVEEPRKGQGNDVVVIEGFSEER